MRFFIALIFIAFALPLYAQTPLHQHIADIANDAHGKVYVACLLPGITLDCDLNAHGHPPMLSTFKFPLAVAVLQQVQSGKLKLDQPIAFRPSDHYDTVNSPLQDKYPNATVTAFVPLRELLKLTLSQSDNVGANILLHAAGGTEAVQHSLNALGFSSIHIHDDEHTMHDNAQLQYRNDAEPIAMVGLLRRIADNSPLNPELNDFLLDMMFHTTNGPGRIRGLLPKGTPVAHKTGTSDTIHGITVATNDVGLITLPNGHKLAVAIFVTDSTADTAMRESVIARIAKAIYDDAVAQTK